MKTITTLIIALTVICYTNSAKSQNLPGAIHRIHMDKVEHFGAGALISGTTQIIAYSITQNRGKSMLIGFGTGVAAGIAKELYDATGHGCPSFRDAFWTSVGAGVASVSLRYTIQAKPRIATGL